MLHETKLESGENMIIVHSAFPTSLTVESNGHLSSQAEQAKYAQCNTVTFAAPAAIAPAGLLFSSVMTFFVRALQRGQTLLFVPSPLCFCSLLQL